jgi:hypothetical protein
MSETTTAETIACHGSCHCRRVRFRVTLPKELEAQKCNCSICRQTGFIHVIVGKFAFELLAGEADLVEYRFNTGTARHLFCRYCGIKSFYVPRSHPDRYSINLNCLESIRGVRLRMTDFDGQNWEQNIDQLKDRASV